MNQTIIMPEVNEYTLGQLMFLLEMTTAYEGELLDIDAFNQPGVGDQQARDLRDSGQYGREV